MGAVPDRWGVYPLEKKGQNETEFQYDSSQVGVPTELKTDNTQSELEAK